MKYLELITDPIYVANNKALLSFIALFTVLFIYVVGLCISIAIERIKSL